MRKIKFRALDTGTNEWSYFSLQDLIIGEASHNLRFKNWCECTGLKDKNGKEIYEGDMVEFWDEDLGTGKGVVEFRNGEYVAKTGKRSWWCGLNFPKHNEVIGNILDENAGGKKCR